VFAGKGHTVWRQPLKVSSWRSRASQPKGLATHTPNQQHHQPSTTCPHPCLPGLQISSGHIPWGGRYGLRWCDP
jgi:hypothetical protein